MTYKEQFLNDFRKLAEKYADSQVSKDADSKKWHTCYWGYFNGMKDAFGIWENEK